jgi:hypothetical protein
VTLFGNRVSADDQVKMRSLGWALIQYDWYPYEEGKFGHRDRHIQKQHDVKIHRECQVQDKEYPRP